MIPAARIDDLLSELCTELGYCLPRIERERLIAAPWTTAEEFARAVFAAEGMTPESATKAAWRQVLERVTRAFEREWPV